MANLKNWMPDMTLAEREWFDKCPKAVLFEIARQFGMRVADDFSADAAFRVMADEWAALHANGICPQKPAKVRTEDEILARMSPEIRALYTKSETTTRGPTYAVSRPRLHHRSHRRD